MSFTERHSLFLYLCMSVDARLTRFAVKPLDSTVRAIRDLHSSGTPAQNIA